MEHEDALERIEIAATEPDGLERLMAGDTPDAIAVAGHLAGCAACTAELAQIRRTAAIARDVIRSQPDPALRARTLAFVRAEGRDRSAGASPVAATARIAGAPLPAPAADGVGGVLVGRAASGGEIARAPGGAGNAEAPHAAVTSPTEPGPTPIDRARRRGRVDGARLAILGLAAALVVAIGGGALAYQSQAASGRAVAQAKDDEIAVLEDTARTTLRLQAQPDARRIELAPATPGAAPAGTLLFSPSSGELVAIATDLTPESAGQSYACWVEVNGARRRLGRMYWAGSLWAWAGSAPGLAALPPGSRFGVSLEPAAGGPPAAPVLTGAL